MSRVLGVGVATLDLVSEVDAYPAEDSETRASAQRHGCGGNVANTLSVLSLLNHDCAFAGVLADDVPGALVRDELVRRGIDVAEAVVDRGGSTPVSCVLISRAGGSRTIVHHRDLREFGRDDFGRIPLDGLDWLHFEGRNVAECRAMLDRVLRRRPELTVSLEVEKPRPGIETLFAGPSWIFFSRVYAQARGYTEPLGLLQDVHRAVPCAGLVCSWGEQGAQALDPEGGAYHSPAFPPARLRDSLGAGDTFNAGMIDALVKGGGVGKALESASRLAGRKCGMTGFDGLAPGKPQAE